MAQQSPLGNFRKVTKTINGSGQQNIYTPPNDCLVFCHVRPFADQDLGVDGVIFWDSPDIQFGTTTRATIWGYRDGFIYRSPNAGAFVQGGKTLKAGQWLNVGASPVYITLFILEFDDNVF